MKRVHNFFRIKKFHENTDQFSLLLIKDKIQIEIPNEGGTIGRNGTIKQDYFQFNPYMSRLHARIIHSDSGYLILDEGSTNGTQINHIKLTPGKCYLLCKGDRLVLADIELQVI